MNKKLKIYASRNYTYAWFDKDGLIEQAGNLHNKIDNITDDGLPEKKFYTDTFHVMMEEAATVNKFQQTDITLELMLTAQYFFYAQNVWIGLGSKAMPAVDWDLPQKKISYEALLDSLLEIPLTRYIATKPVYPQYAKLKEST